MMAFFGLFSLQVVVPRQFARVCHSVNIQCGVEGKKCGCHCPSQLQQIYSQIFEPLKPLKILRMYIFREIKCDEEHWRVEDRAQAGRRKSLMAETIIKIVRERIHWNLVCKQKIMSQGKTYRPSLHRALTGTINT